MPSFQSFIQSVFWQVNTTSVYQVMIQYWYHTNAQLLLNGLRSSSWHNRTVCNFPVDRTFNVYKPFIIWLFAPFSQARDQLVWCETNIWFSVVVLIRQSKGSSKYKAYKALRLSPATLTCKDKAYKYNISHNIYALLNSISVTDNS